MTKNIKRIEVKEEHRVLDGLYVKVEIGEFISKLQQLQNQGWKYVETDKYYDYSDDYYEVNVTKMRPENDEEYNKRVEQQKHYEDIQRRQYEDLKKKFEND